MNEIVELILEIAEEISKEIKAERKKSMKSLIKDLGGEICETDNLLDLFNGTVEKTSDNGFKIFLYNSSKTLEKENFEIAKEIGHLILHIGFGTEKWKNIPKGKIILKNVDYDTIETEKEEDYISFSTAWSTPLPIFEKMVKINPDTWFQVKYYDEDTGNNCGIIEYFPDIEPLQPFDNVASVEYDNGTGELKVLKTALVSKDLAKDWNANVILTKKGLLIIYNDYTEYGRHSKCFSEKEKEENFKKWYFFADGLEEDWDEIYEED